MPVVKGGVWTNIEDEILKASVSKYGLNQWARVSSLLARKTPKQCKARWFEWLDPGIRKVEWSKEEDEKLLHLAKLMPTQWRTIAPIVGRTATQCLERYQKLLDEAESRESEELGLAGPEGGETAAPSADDVRKLRPGELDPDPESKPARPDTIDLDEDEKEMLSEARARLANTQGKKAKRKARERQLEESRRLALLQKRRELKNAGINIKVTTRKKGQMDYNADIPFEKPAAPGFYDTKEEEDQNEKQRAAFDPRKQQLQNKRKGEPDEDEEDRKRRKNEKNGQSAGFQAAQKAAQQQKIREAEQSSKRRALMLPAPQVGEGELEDILKMGMAGERASRLAASGDNNATRGLVGNYSTIVDGTPIRTPRAPQEEDRVANEIRNARARTETQSALLGGENTPLYEGSGSTGYSSATPSRSALVTPNPMATPFRQGGANGVGATPLRGAPWATPMAGTPLQKKGGVKSLLASLPKPKQAEWEFELPEEEQEMQALELSAEDAADRDRRQREMQTAAELAEFRRQTQVIQKALPVPTAESVQYLDVSDPISAEMARLIMYDNAQLRRIKKHTPLEFFDANVMSRATQEVALEVKRSLGGNELPGLAQYDDEDETDLQRLTSELGSLSDGIIQSAERGKKVEKKLGTLLGGYQIRSKTLRQKIVEADEALKKTRTELHTSRTAVVYERSAIERRLEALRDEVSFISRREREAQDSYRARKDELDSLGVSVNGFH